MHKYIVLTSLTLLLAACVDTTGIDPTSSKTPRGNPNAAVTIMEYSDFECPACRVAHAIITKPLLEKYGAQVRFEHRQFPLPSHAYSLPLAEVSECAADQGKFWEFADMAYEKQLAMDQEEPPRQVNQADIDAWSRELNVADQDLFDRCVESHIKRKAIMAEFEEARAAGAPGTPTYFVNGEQIATDLASLELAIDTALANEAQRQL